MTKILAACLMLAAQSYAVPPAVLMGIYQVEGGKVSMEVGPNSNGSYDLGPMQINTIWLPELAKKWGVSEDTAYRWVRDDACTNVGVSAWILRQHYDRTGDMAEAIAHYHSRTEKYGNRYQGKVIERMVDNGLVRLDENKNDKIHSQ